MSDNTPGSNIQSGIEMLFVEIEIDHIRWHSEGWDRLHCSYLPADATGKLAALQQSITEHGVLQPVLLQADDDRSFTIIAGSRRVTSARNAGLSRIPSLVLPPSSELIALTLWLESNVTMRELNEMEKARAIAKLMRLHDGDARRIGAHWAARLGVPANPESIEDYAALLTLPHQQQDDLAEGRLHPQNAGLLLRLQPRDRDAIYAAIFATCAPSASDFRELIELCQQISIREQTRIFELLQEQEVRTILEHAALPPREKGRRLKKLLLQRRFPEREARLQQFEAMSKEAASSTQQVMTPLLPKNFEKDEVQMMLRLRDAGDIDELAKALGSSRVRNSVQALFALLRDEERQA